MRVVGAHGVMPRAKMAQMSRSLTPVSRVGVDERAAALGAPLDQDRRPSARASASRRR